MSAPVISVYFPAMPNRMNRIYEFGNHADFTIICGHYHFKVHKAVITAQLEYFKAAFKANTFKVRYMVASCYPR